MDKNIIYIWTINILKLVNMKNTFHIINNIKVFFVLPFLRSKTNLVQWVDYFCCEIWTWLYLYVIYFNLSVVDLDSTGITFNSNDPFVWFQKWDFLCWVCEDSNFSVSFYLLVTCVSISYLLLGFSELRNWLLQRCSLKTDTSLVIYMVFTK